MNLRASAIAATIAASILIVASCDDGSRTLEPFGAEPEQGTGVPTDTTPVGTPDAGSSQVEAPDAGTPPPPPPPPDAGVPPVNTGPWPLDAQLDYTRTYELGTPQSVGLDEGLNLWLLDGNRIGVLRPGDTRPTWSRGIGQARQPFGGDSLALNSTVICGGEAGRAYVGYRAHEMKRQEGISQRTYIPGPGEPNYSPERYAEYQKGDLDAVRLQEDGTVVLEEHLWRTTSLSSAGKQIGIHNTNDYHYEEDRTVLACARVTRGAYKGDLFITTNHGVTRIQGLVYNSHRHPGWYLWVTREDGSKASALQAPPMHGLGIGANGDVLVANEQMVGVLVPGDKLEDWDTELTWEGPTPWRYKGYNHVLNGQASDDYWRAFEQVAPGRYFLGSAQYGVWSLVPKTRSAAEWTKLGGLPTERILSLKATDAGSLYIGTDGAGLWRLAPDGTTLTRVAGVAGQKVLQLVYEPSVTPAMLLVLTDAGLTVLREP